MVHPTKRITETAAPYYRNSGATKAERWVERPLMTTPAQPGVELG